MGTVIDRDRRNNTSTFRDSKYSGLNTPITNKPGAISAENNIATNIISFVETFRMEFIVSSVLMVTPD